MLTLASRRKLSSGVEIPLLGLGVWQSPRGEPTYRAVRAALDAGYRHVDTAAAYGNERDVGKAVKESGIPREEIFVTTKLWNDDHGSERAPLALEKSLGRLGLDYVDLYLIHWPVPRLRRESWRVLQGARDEGKCRAIGVSNYTIAHLEEVLRESSGPPDVNQVELHPFLTQEELCAFCAEKGVAMEAYSPLTSGKRIADPKVAEVAKRVGRTPAQVLLRWSLQKGFIVLPKSITPARIVENAKLYDFELPEAEMSALDALDEDLRTCWDPSDVD